MKKLNTISKIRGALKQFTLGLAVSAAVAFGSGLTANAAPPNDNFADAIDLPGASGIQTGTDTIGATLEPDEPATVTYPDNTTSSFTNTVWFKWTCPEAGKLTVDTFGSTNPDGAEWDSVLGIYTGASVNALTPLGPSPLDTGVPETMTVAVTAGTIYHIQLAGWDSTPAANIVLNWTLDNLDNGAAIVTFGANVAESSAVITITGPTTGTVDWTVPYGTALATLAPTFTLSAGATCNQTSGAVPTPNFSTGPVHYIVTAAGASATRDYTVTITVAPPSAACDMLTFGANVAGSVAFITDTGPTTGTVDWYLPYGTAVTALAPTFTLSFGATCVPTSGTTKDFTSPQTYRVTAQDGSTFKDYVVTATAAAESALVWSAGGPGDWDFTTPNWIGQTTATPQPFANAYNVIFDATGVGGTINIPAAVYPLTTTVSNANYEFSGGPIAMGSLTKSGSGTLRIDVMDPLNYVAVIPNTYSGGTIMNGGLLHLGAMQNGLSPLCTGTVGTGPVTLNGGTIRFDRITETNALISNGGTIASDNGWGASWNGPVTLNAIMTSDVASGNAGTVTLGGAISGIGGLLKTGFNTLTLSGTNNYSGATTVTAGTLKCDNVNALGNGGTLSISSPGVVNLNYTGEHNVAALTLGGVSQTSGTYGSTSSGATVKNDTYFAGTGVVRVPLSSFKNMLTFSFGVLGNAAIAGTNITLLVPNGTDRTRLAPTYTVSPGATGSPLSSTTHDFTSPQVYTVTAEDLSTLAYQVTVSEAVLANVFTWTNTASGNWSVAANWTNENASVQAPVGGGRSSYTLNFNEAGTYTATNNLNSGFVLNQINLGGSNVTLAGNSLSFVADGSTLPTINQNSATGGATINPPLNLATNITVGGTGGAQVDLANVISGTGSLTKSTPGVLKIYGLVPNTYSGGTMISSGTLWVGTMVAGISPLCTGVLGTGPVTLGIGTTIQFDNVTTTNALISNGGTFYSQNGWGVTWSGPITLNADTTFRAQYTLTCSGAISGTGGLIKTSGGPMILSGINSYAGPTTVTAGTLKCNNVNALGTGGLSIDTGAMVNLNYTGTHFVPSLTLDGIVMPRGTYGSSGSGWGDDVHFDAAGTGTVTVFGPAEIIAFAAAGRAGVIDQAASTINVSVPFGTDLATLAPTFTLSSGTCTPTSGTPPTPSFAVQNPATYTVTDGAITTVYLVTVNVEPTIFVTYDLGASGSGTTIPSGVAGLIPWIAKGTLPPGSILRSVSVDATLDVAITDNWASDICAYVDPSPDNPGTAAALMVGGYGDIGTVALRLDWANGQNGAGTTVRDTKTDTDWNSTTGDIDLSTALLSVGNGYNNSPIWSGKITVEFNGVPATFLEFGLPGNLAVYTDTNSLTLTVPYGTALAALAPNYKLSSGTCDKASGSTQNFTTPQTYTVIDGAIKNVFTVTVTTPPAPIVFGATGAPLQTFDAGPPPVAEWSTLSVAGGAGDVTTDGGLDTMMTGIAASSISTAIPTQAGSGTLGTAYWRADNATLGTQPTGNKATLLMATLYNSSGNTVSAMGLSYTFGLFSITPNETPGIKGHRVYWSKTGAAGAWTAVGDFTLAAPGSTTVSTSLNSLNWANGSTLYVVWADDNGANNDGDYTIDNVSFTSAAPPRPILPPGSFTYVAGGVPTFTNVPTTAGYTYWLTYNDSLTSAIWTRIGTGTAGGGNKTFTDTVTPYPASRFYRLEAQ